MLFEQEQAGGLGGSENSLPPTLMTALTSSSSRHCSKKHISCTDLNVQLLRMISYRFVIYCVQYSNSDVHHWGTAALWLRFGLALYLMAFRSQVFVSAIFNHRSGHLSDAAWEMMWSWLRVIQMRNKVKILHDCTMVDFYLYVLSKRIYFSADFTFTPYNCT